ncbi:hypothetical protein SNEBB_005068 [Seison nebaliae]|nr:hypothetical protein SNEBB_005068 [Seison nebaliae]
MAKGEESLDNVEEIAGKLEDLEAKLSEVENTKENVEQKSGRSKKSGNRKKHKSEKKHKKTLAKFLTQQLPQYNCVTIRKPGATAFAIKNAEVYKVPNMDSYIVFGEAKIEDATSKLDANRYMREDLAKATKMMSEPKGNSGDMKDDGKKDNDDSDVDSDDDIEIPMKDDKPMFTAQELKMVMEEGKVSKKKACKFLTEESGDMVTAILRCTE